MAIDPSCIFHFTLSFQVYLQLNISEEFDDLICGSHLMTKFVVWPGRILFFRHFLDLCHVDLVVIFKKSIPFTLPSAHPYPTVITIESSENFYRWHNFLHR